MIDNLPVKKIPLPTPFPVGDINAYLIMSDPLTIVDPGPYYRPAGEALKSAVSQAGIGLEDIKRIVITHGHPDHYGMAGKIQKDTGAEIYVRDIEIKKLVLDDNYVNSLRATLYSTGIKKDILDLDGLFRGEVPFTHSIEDIVPFSEKSGIEFKDFRIKLLHTPGHSSGHTCLYWEEKGVLFSGDSLLPDISAIPSIEYDPGSKNLRGRSLSQFFQTFELISSLKPSVCLPGHGEAVSKPGELAKSRIDFHKSRLDEIYDIVPPGGESPVSAYRIAGIYYPEVRGFDRLLSVIEVVSHLDFLVDEGRINEQINEDGVSLFYR
ncbi:MAG: MBL fold metallo-hydrolase [Bacillota bacterium]